MSHHIPGYFLSAIGVDHILMAHNFATTLKINGDGRPICILVKPEHVGFARDLDFIDFVVEYTPGPDYGVMTDHERFCGMAKIDFHDKIPLDKYIMVDTDFLCCAPTDKVWKMLADLDQPVVNFGTIDAPWWHWNELPNIEKKTGLKLSYTCGDIVYFNKAHPDFKDHLSLVRDVFVNDYDKFGCKRLFGPKHSKTEEVAFAIAAGKHGYKPIEMHKFPIINYNPQPNEPYHHFKFPFESITDKNTVFDSRPPFIHLWDKYWGLNYQRIFFEIISGIVKQMSPV